MIEILCEAANRVPKEIQEEYPNIPWKTIIGMRNIIIHVYDKVDQEEVWDTVKEDVPKLIVPITSVLSDLQKKENI